MTARENLAAAERAIGAAIAEFEAARRELAAVEWPPMPTTTPRSGRASPGE